MISWELDVTFFLQLISTPLLVDGASVSILSFDSSSRFYHGNFKRKVGTESPFLKKKKKKKNDCHA